MENSELTQLLQKYLRGECTPQEQADVDAWFLDLDKHPDDTRLLNEAQEQLLEESMLANVKTRLALKASYIPRRLGILLKVAASLVAIALVGVAFYKFDNAPASNIQGPVITSAENHIITISNSSQEIREHILSDGSKVNLHPAGVLEFPETFDKKSRRVKLRGEAFFDVSKEKSRPFIICTKDVTVKVLGTSFNVRAYEGADEITVAVRTGKVSVSRPASANAGLSDVIILTPNQEVVYSKVKEHFHKKLVDSPQIILARPTLFEMKYDEAPVNKILEVLEENYGIDIVYDPTVLSTCTLTTAMSEEGLYERIEIICKAIGAQYEILDSTIVITSKGCK
jgi:ferric-dicitrate binding protein FerR (iron transport regulator)